jgi:hypothetical protein
MTAGEHTCENVWVLKYKIYGYLSRRIQIQLKPSLKSFEKAMQKELNLVPNRYKIASCPRPLNRSMEMRRSSLTYFG